MSIFGFHQRFVQNSVDTNLPGEQITLLPQEEPRGCETRGANQGAKPALHRLIEGEAASAARYIR